MAPFYAAVDRLAPPPPSVDDWLPERLDLLPFVKAYRGSGSAAHHPSVLLGLLIYGYTTGVYPPASFPFRPSFPFPGPVRPSQAPWRPTSSSNFVPFSDF